jgi:hypothetical protein
MSSTEEAERLIEAEPRGDQYDLLEAAALDQAQRAPTLDERAKNIEILKNIAEARSSAQTSKNQQRTLFLITAATPLLALIVTAITIIVQYRQFQKTLGQQAVANEDAQWREALKSVSFADQPSSQIGAIAMQGFFASPRFRSQARTIAGALLTNVPNVNAFDEVLSRMRDNTVDRNFTDLSVVGQMLGYAQRMRYHISGAASKENTPFLIEDVDEIDPNPTNLDRDRDQQVKVAAWELDTASQCLRQVWKRKGTLQSAETDRPVSPSRKVLTGIVLENAKSVEQNFDGLNFSGANFDFGILYNASFRGANFSEAKLKNVYFRGVVLTDADFSGVTVYEGSRWEESNWWDAKCVPQPMLDYLLRVDPRDLTVDTRTRLTSNCHK